MEENKKVEDFSSYKYEVASVDENGMPFKIRKTGHTVDFTMAEVEDHKKKLNKLHTELISQGLIEAAKIANIESYHPDVKDVTDEELAKYHTYFEAKQRLAIVKLKESEVIQALKEYDEELKEIAKQCQ